MKTIILNRNKSTLVDDGDFLSLSQWKWRCDPQYGYAIRTKYLGKGLDGKKKTTIVRMHREIIKPENGKEVDHINGDRLDNRRSNLRPATRQENSRNKLPNPGKFTKGICWREGRNKWQTSISVNNKSVYLGLFSEKHVALEAYDNAAKKYFGEFARLNF